MSNKYPTIENWKVVKRGRSPYTPPEQMTNCFDGISYGHKFIIDGKPILTSEVISWIPVPVETDGEFVIRPLFLTETGSRYLLGTPEAKYAELFPEPLKRIMKSLKQA